MLFYLLSVNKVNSWVQMALHHAPCKKWQIIRVAALKAASSGHFWTLRAMFQENCHTLQFVSISSSISLLTSIWSSLVKRKWGEIRGWLWKLDGLQLRWIESSKKWIDRFYSYTGLAISKMSCDINIATKHDVSTVSIITWFPLFNLKTTHLWIGSLEASD